MKKTAVLILTILASTPAAASDRPGTPNNLAIDACGLSRETNDAPAGGTLCLLFNNTATEEVIFEFEFTEGASSVQHAWNPLQQKFLHQAYCINRDTASAVQAVLKQPIANPHRSFVFNYGCTGTDNFNGFFDMTAKGRTNIDVEQGHRDQVEHLEPPGVIARPQSLKITHLDFDSQYCIRVRSRAVGSQMVSENWSNLVCATTQSPPPPPGTPANFTSTYTPGGTDWRAAPPRIDLAWNSGGNTDAYAIEYGVITQDDIDSISKGFSTIDRYMGASVYFLSDGTEANSQYKRLGDRFTPDITGFHYHRELNLDEVNAGARLSFRICALSAMGRACTARLSGLPIDRTSGMITETPMKLPGGYKVDVTQAPSHVVTPPNVINAISAKETRMSHLTNVAEPQRSSLQDSKIDLAAKVGPLPRLVSGGGPTGENPMWMIGTFDSDFGVLTLSALGGSYTHQDGHVRVTGRNGADVEGVWQELSGTHRCADGTYHGRFRFEFTATGFTGSYGYCDDPPGAGRWNGARR